MSFLLLVLYLILKTVIIIMKHAFLPGYWLVFSTWIYFQIFTIFISYFITFSGND